MSFHTEDIAPSNSFPNMMYHKNVAHRLQAYPSLIICSHVMGYSYMIYCDHVAWHILIVFIKTAACAFPELIYQNNMARVS